MRPQKPARGNFRKTQKRKNARTQERKTQNAKSERRKNAKRRWGREHGRPILGLGPALFQRARRRGHASIIRHTIAITWHHLPSSSISIAEAIAAPFVTPSQCVQRLSEDEPNRPYHLNTLERWRQPRPTPRNCMPSLGDRETGRLETGRQGDWKTGRPRDWKTG